MEVEMKDILHHAYEWKECMLVLVVWASLHWQGQGTGGTLMECRGAASEALEEERAAHNETKKELAGYKADRKLLESLSAQINNHTDMDQ